MQCRTVVWRQEEDERLEREWNKTPTNGTIIEENDDEFDEFDDDDDGQTVYGGDADQQSPPGTFRDYDHIDHDAAVTIQANYRGYRARRQLADRQF